MSCVVCVSPASPSFPFLKAGWEWRPEENQPSRSHARLRWVGWSRRGQDKTLHLPLKCSTFGSPRTWPLCDPAFSLGPQGKERPSPSCCSFLACCPKRQTAGQHATRLLSVSQQNCSLSHPRVLFHACCTQHGSLAEQLALTLSAANWSDQSPIESWGPCPIPPTQKSNLQTPCFPLQLFPLSPGTLLTVHPPSERS